MPDPKYVLKPLAAPHAEIHRQLAITFVDAGSFVSHRDRLAEILKDVPHKTLAEIADLRLVAIQVGPGPDVAKLLEKIRLQEFVESAVSNRPVSLNAAPVNDPLYREQWALNTIQAEPAWIATQGAIAGAGQIIVAVVDTGISTTHPDLVGHLWDDGAGHHGFNLLTGLPDVPDPDGHGTFLAGTIGAISNNAVGIAAASWPVRILTMKFHDVRFPPTALAGAIGIWLAAAVLQAKVINVAWDVGIPWPPLKLAIQVAGGLGALVVAAAGNDGLDNDQLRTYPANFGAPPFNLSNLISVMATDEDDDKPGFSNYGRTTVHLAAPGVRIISTHSFFGAPRWREYSGTSAACAYVSYAAALVRLLNPGLSPAAVRQRLINTADARPWLRCVARGRLNLANAV